jgi:hypothetical protein
MYLYRESDWLVEALCDYIGPALAGGNAAIVVATPRHRNALEHRLMARGMSTYKASQQGCYIALDASETLSIGGIISAARDFLRNGHSKIAIFGEMVALLSAQGKIEAAIRLKQLWNDLAIKHSFSLRCAYPIANFSGEKSTQPLIRVCAEHSAVLFDENDESSLDLRFPCRLQNQSCNREVSGKKLCFSAAGPGAGLLIAAALSFRIFL